MQSQLSPTGGRWAARSAVVAAAAFAAMALVACGSDGPTSNTPPGQTTATIKVAFHSPPDSVWAVQGETCTWGPVTVTRGAGYTGAVSLTVEGLPSGVTASFDPATLGPGMTRSEVSFAVAADAATWRGNVTIRATGFGVSDATTVFQFVILPPWPEPPSPWIDIQLALGTLSVVQGQSTSVAVTASRGGGYTGAVTLTVRNAPPGVTATLDPSVVPSGVSSAALTLATTPSTAVGTYHFSVFASGAGVADRSASLTLNVTTPPAPISVAFIPDDDFVWTVQGDTWTWPGVTVTRGAGYTGAVHLTIEGLPSGVTASFNPAALDPGMTTSEVSFTAAADAPAGSSKVIIRATGVGVPGATTAFRFIVFPPA